MSPRSTGPSEVYAIETTVRLKTAGSGFGVATTGGSTPNMATAGLASLFLVFDMYHGKKPYSRANPRTFTEGDAAAVREAEDP